MIDVVYRCGWFDPAFRPNLRVRDELLLFVDHFDPVKEFAPTVTCYVNPEFAASRYVGGADADLIVDDNLIDLKTTAKLHVSLNYLLQLAGYVALQRMGGIVVGQRKRVFPLRRTQLYFARYGASLCLDLDELFPSDGFERFFDVFAGEIAADEERRAEIAKRCEMRRQRSQLFEQLARARSPRALLMFLARNGAALSTEGSPSWRHEVIFDAVRQTILSYGGGAGGPRRPRSQSSADAVRDIRAMRTPVAILMEFLRHRNEFAPLSEPKPSSRIQSVLLRQARLVATDQV